MTAFVLTSSSSSSSSKSSTTEDRSNPRSETPDSCYFPRCRKDANCNCEMCLESINATLDLMPKSIQNSSLTKICESKPFAERTPIPFKSYFLSTPTKGFTQVLASPVLKSTAKSNLLEETELKKKRKKRKRNLNIGFNFWKFLVGLSMIYAMDSAFSLLVFGVLDPTLSPEIVRSIGEEAAVRSNLNEKLVVLKKRLEETVEEELLDCSLVDSSWELNQDGLLANSRCTLYTSIAEEVSIWGWPLQNSGLLVTGFSSRSLTILSGGVTEWKNGKPWSTVIKTNSSWIIGKLSRSAVQMDANTWILEYRKNSLLGYSRLSLALMEFVKFAISRVIEEAKLRLFMLPNIFVQRYDSHGDNSFICPT